MRTLFYFVLTTSLLLLGCEPTDPGGENPNAAPETRLSNIPPDSITSSSPLLTLSWLGDDPDGFVTAYRYTWTYQQTANDPVETNPDTYILNIVVSGFAMIMLGDENDAPKVYKYFSTLPPEGLDTATTGRLAAGDTVFIEGVGVFASNPDGVRYPVHVSPTTGTFIFESQDVLNPHTFTVSAIDNLGELDTSPSTVQFFTPRVAPPNTIIIDGPDDTVLVLTRFTDTFTGIRFQFQGFDPNSRTIEYSWVVDRDVWTSMGVDPPWSEWSLNDFAFVNAGDFPDSLGTDHIMYVRGRNEFGAIDTLGYFTRFNNATQQLDTIYSRFPFNSIYPKFAQVGSAQRILIINNTHNWDTLHQPIRPNWAALRQYYSDLYDALGYAGRYDIVDVETSPDFPGRGLLGQYSMVHLMCDIGNDFYRFPSLTAGNQTKLIDYCYVGGKLLVSGWNIPRPDNLPPLSEFINNILHVTDYQAVQAPQWVGSYPQVIPDPVQYTPGPLDTTKLDSAWGLGPGLVWCWMLRPYGFGEIIYRFDSADDILFFEGAVTGVRYIGLTYDSIFLAFPLYYVEKPYAVEILRKVLSDFKHL